MSQGAQTSEHKNPAPSCDVIPVTTPEHLDQFKSMTIKYLEWLAEDLCFQGIDDELAGLPGSFAKEVGGTMLIALDSTTNTCIGAVALRALQGKQLDGMQELEGMAIDDIAEMKRLFVQPAFHGQGVGRALALAVMKEAATLGYKAVVLDTLERLSGANQLYKRIGFEECMPYNICPLPGVMYWLKRLEK